MEWVSFRGRRKILDDVFRGCSEFEFFKIWNQNWNSEHLWDTFEKFNDASDVIFQFNGRPRRKSSVDAIWTSRIFPSITSFAHWYFDHVGFHISLQNKIVFILFWRGFIYCDFIYPNLGIYDSSQLRLQIVERYDGKDPFTRDSFTENGEWQIVDNRTFHYVQMINGYK